MRERLGRKLLHEFQREVAMGAKTMGKVAAFRTCFDGRVWQATCSQMSLVTLNFNLSAPAISGTGEAMWCHMKNGSPRARQNCVCISAPSVASCIISSKLLILNLWNGCNFAHLTHLLWGLEVDYESASILLTIYFGICHYSSLTCSLWVPK